MENVVITILTKSYLTSNLDDFLVIDKEIKQADWSANNFLCELPQKWMLSRIATIDKQLVGFLIASKKTECVHIHRLAVHPGFQSKGIGVMLVEQLGIEANRQRLAITLKVHNLNSRAIRFYQSLNFKIAAELGDNLLLHRDI